MAVSIPILVVFALLSVGLVRTIALALVLLIVARGITFLVMVERERRAGHLHVDGLG